MLVIGLNVQVVATDLGYKSWIISTQRQNPLGILRYTSREVPCR